MTIAGRAQVGPADALLTSIYAAHHALQVSDTVKTERRRRFAAFLLVALANTQQKNVTARIIGRPPLQMNSHCLLAQPERAIELQQQAGKGSPTIPSP